MTPLRRYRALCDAVDLPDLAAVPDPERVARRTELRGRLAGRFAVHDLVHWESVVADVPCAAVVRAPSEVLDDPQAAARGLLPSVGGRTLLRQPLVVDGHRPGPARGVPELGEHTEEVLREIGVPDDTLAAVLAARY